MCAGEIGGEGRGGRRRDSRHCGRNCREFLSPSKVLYCSCTSRLNTTVFYSRQQPGRAGLRLKPVVLTPRQLPNTSTSSPVQRAPARPSPGALYEAVYSLAGSPGAPVAGPDRRTRDNAAPQERRTRDQMRKQLELVIRRNEEILHVSNTEPTFAESVTAYVVAEKKHSLIIC